MKKLLGVVVLTGSILATGCGHNAGTDDNGTPAPLPQQHQYHDESRGSAGTEPRQTTTNTVETPRLLPRPTPPPDDSPSAQAFH